MSINISYLSLHHMDFSFFFGTQKDQRLFLVLLILFVSLLIPVVYLATRKVPRPPRTTTYYPYPGPEDSASTVEFKVTSR